MKAIKCNTPKGIYLIPLRIIAEARANYYGVAENFEKGGEEWNEEFDYVMNDEHEGVNWMINNSSWKDWKRKAKKISDKINVTEDDFWSTINFEIVIVKQ